MQSPIAARAERYAALDAARGLAVIAMIYTHFVPSEGAASGVGRALAHLAHHVEAPSAALFCVLAGMALEIQAQRAGDAARWRRYFLRRMAVLGLMGAAFHAIWPTEILVTLAAMLALSLGARSLGRRGVVGAAVAVLLAAPLLAMRLGPYVAADWNADGTHVVGQKLGWAAVRFLAFDGNYPLVPWLAFALLGMRMLADGLPPPQRARRCLGAALVIGIVAQVGASWAAAHPTAIHGLEPVVMATWVPTSIPFTLIAGGLALAPLCLMLSCRSTAAMGLLARMGQASLSHYILHIALVIWPLRLIWPDEGWSLRVGLLLFVGYMGLALPLTALWFRRFSYGPIERVWALAANWGQVRISRG